MRGNSDDELRENNKKIEKIYFGLRIRNRHRIEIRRTPIRFCNSERKMKTLHERSSYFLKVKNYITN